MIEWSRPQELFLLNLVCYHKPIGKQKDSNYKMIISKLNEKFPEIKATKTSVNKILHKYYDLKGLSELDAEDQELELKEEDTTQEEKPASKVEEKEAELSQEIKNSVNSTANEQKEEEIEEDDIQQESNTEVRESNSGKAEEIGTDNDNDNDNDNDDDADADADEEEEEEEEAEEQSEVDDSNNDSISMRINKRIKNGQSDVETTEVEIEDKDTESFNEQAEEEENNDQSSDEENEKAEISKRENSATPKKRGRGRPPKIKKSDEVVTPKIKAENKKHDNSLSVSNSSRKRLKHDTEDDEDDENDMASVADESDAETMPPPKKRGRKPKLLQSHSDHEEEHEDSPDQIVIKPTPSKKRGRRPRHPRVESSVEDTPVAPTPAKRGRKPKVHVEQEDNDSDVAPTPLKRGRKSKVHAEEENESDVGPTPLRRGRKSVVLVEGTPMETPSRRGRPRKNSTPGLTKISEKLRVEAEDTNESENSNIDDNLPARHTRRRSRLSEDENAPAVKPTPRRGRPPKTASVTIASSEDEKPEETPRGRKRGRPKLVESAKKRKRSMSSKKSEESDAAEPPSKTVITRSLRKNSKSDVEGRSTDHETSELESDANDGDEEDEESDDDEAKSATSATPRKLRKAGNVETPKTTGLAKLKGPKTPLSGMRFTPTRSSKVTKSQATPSVRRSARKK